MIYKNGSLISMIFTTVWYSITDSCGKFHTGLFAPLVVFKADSFYYPSFYWAISLLYIRSLFRQVQEDDVEEVETELPPAAYTRNMVAKFRQLEKGVDTDISPDRKGVRKMTPPRDELEQINEVIYMYSLYTLYGALWFITLINCSSNHLISNALNCYYFNKIYIYWINILYIYNIPTVHCENFIKLNLIALKLVFISQVVYFCFLSNFILERNVNWFYKQLLTSDNFLNNWRISVKISPS